MQTVWTQIRPNKMSGLIWIQTVWHPDGIPERVFQKNDFENKSADDKIHEKLHSMQRAKSVNCKINFNLLLIVGD